MLDFEKYEYFKTLTALPGVKKIILYGSRARGDHRERSDIDLAFELETPETWDQILDVLEDADTLLKFDAVNLGKLSQDALLRKFIDQEGKVLYAKHGF